MSRRRAEELNITSIDDLVEHAPQMRIASTTEFFGRPEWQQLRDTYGLQFADTVSFDPTFMYGAVDRGEVDVISAFSTDGRIAAYDLLVLRDTRRVFPPYDAIVLLSPQASAHPAIAQALAPLHQAIPATDMRRANQLVDVDGQTVSAAAQWLRETIDARGHTLTSSN
jgi:osmoprotectant transport system permease protein